MHAFCGNVAADVEEVLGGGFLLVDAKLDFHGNPFAVRHLDYGVKFPVAVVLIVVERCAERFRIAKKISENKALKEKTERVQVAFEPCGSRFKKRGGDGRIAETAFLRLLDARARPHGRGERTYVFRDEKPFKGIEICGKGFIVNIHVAYGRYVTANGRYAYGGGFVSGERTEQKFHLVSIVLNAVDVGNFPVDEPFGIVGRNFYCLGKGTVYC